MRNEFWRHCLFTCIFLKRPLGGRRRRRSVCLPSFPLRELAHLCEWSGVAALMRQLHAWRLVWNQFEMGWQRKHALQRRGAVSCGLTSQNRFPPALSRLEAAEAPWLNLFLSAAAERHGWAHEVPVMVEEEEEEEKRRAEL